MRSQSNLQQIAGALITPQDHLKEMFKGIPPGFVSKLLLIHWHTRTQNSPIIYSILYVGRATLGLGTEWMEWMSHRKRKETKQQPGTAGPGNILGCCLVSLRFLCDIHSIHHVLHLSKHICATKYLPTGMQIQLNNRMLCLVGIHILHCCQFQ